MVPYQRNNIIFRIASADAIAEFKKAQADSFAQLARKELGFDTAAKETVLLEFDRFSQWIFKMERICCAAGEGQMSEHLRATVLESFFDEMTTIETVMGGHPNIFTDGVIEYTKLIHSYSSGILSDKIESAMSIKIDAAFKRIVSITSEYLQHVLLAFHEYNNNLISKLSDPFICASMFGSRTAERFNPALNRARYFIRHSCGTTFVLKNYTEDALYEEAIKFFEDKEIHIAPEDETGHFSQQG